MNARLAYEIKMTPEKLQEIYHYVTNARKHLIEGQVLRVEVSTNVDFVFQTLKPLHSYDKQPNITDRHDPRSDVSPTKEQIEALASVQ